MPDSNIPAGGGSGAASINAIIYDSSAPPPVHNKILTKDEITTIKADSKATIETQVAEGLITRAQADQAEGILDQAQLTDLVSLVEVQSMISRVFNNAEALMALIKKSFHDAGVDDPFIIASLQAWTDAHNKVADAAKDAAKALQAWLDAPSAESVEAMLKSQQALMLAEQQEANTLRDFIFAWFENLKATKEAIIQEGQLKSDLAYRQATLIVIGAVLSAVTTIAATAYVMNSKPPAGANEASVRAWQTQSEQVTAVGNMLSGLMDKLISQAGGKFAEAEADTDIAEQTAKQTVRKAEMDAYQGMISQIRTVLQQQKDLSMEDMRALDKLVDATLAMFRGQG